MIKENIKKTAYFPWHNTHRSVEIIGDFSNWEWGIPMVLNKERNQWQVDLVFFPGTYEIKFKVNDDPNNLFIHPSLPKQSFGHGNNILLFSHDEYQQGFRPRPLENIKGSCFLNTGLQLLLNCHDWVNFVMKFQEPKMELLCGLQQFFAGRSIRNFYPLLKKYFPEQLNDKDCELLLIELHKKLMAIDKYLVNPISVQLYCRKVCYNCNPGAQWTSGDAYFNFSFFVQHTRTNNHALDNLQDLLTSWCKVGPKLCPTCNNNTYYIEKRVNTCKYLFVSIVGDRLNSIPNSISLLNSNHTEESYTLCGFSQYWGQDTHYRAIVLLGEQWWICDNFIIFSTHPPNGYVPNVRMLVYQKITK